MRWNFISYLNLKSWIIGNGPFMIWSYIWLLWYYTILETWFNPNSCIVQHGLNRCFLLDTLKFVQPRRANDMLIRLKVMLFDGPLNTLYIFILYDTQGHDMTCILISWVVPLWKPDVGPILRSHFCSSWLYVGTHSLWALSRNHYWNIIVLPRDST